MLQMDPAYPIPTLSRSLSLSIQKIYVVVIIHFAQSHLRPILTTAKMTVFEGI